jgi:hypothetical protein
MFNLFISGGPVNMSVLTVVLVALFFAAWKAPRWVNEIGKFGFIYGLMTPLFPLYHLFDTLQRVSESRREFDGLFDFISPGVLFAGKVILIPVIYGMIIYLISLVIRIIQKPRL